LTNRESFAKAAKELLKPDIFLPFGASRFLVFFSSYAFSIADLPSLAILLLILVA
jgi:hypothetical protein